MTGNIIYTTQRNKALHGEAVSCCRWQLDVGILRCHTHSSKKCKNLAKYILKHLAKYANFIQVNRRAP